MTAKSEENLERALARVEALEEELRGKDEATAAAVAAAKEAAFKHSNAVASAAKEAALAHSDDDADAAFASRAEYDALRAKLRTREKQLATAHSRLRAAAEHGGAPDAAELAKLLEANVRDLAEERERHDALVAARADASRRRLILPRGRVRPRPPPDRRSRPPPRRTPRNFARRHTRRRGFAMRRRRFARRRRRSVATRSARVARASRNRRRRARRRNATPPRWRKI